MQYTCINTLGQDVGIVSAIDGFTADHMNDCESVIQVSGDGIKDSVGMSDYLNLSNGVSGSHSVEYLAVVAHDSAHIQYFKKCNIKPIIVNSGVSCFAIADMKRSPR